MVTLHGDVVAGEGSIIRNGAYIIGPVVIGKNLISVPIVLSGHFIGNNVHRAMVK